MLGFGGSSSSKLLWHFSIPVGQEGNLHCPKNRLASSHPNRNIHRGQPSISWKADISTSCPAWRAGVLFQDPTWKGWVGYLTLPTTNSKKPLKVSKNPEGSQDCLPLPALFRGKLVDSMLVRVHECRNNSKTTNGKPVPSLKLIASFPLKMEGWKTILSFWGKRPSFRIHAMYGIFTNLSLILMVFM